MRNVIAIAVALILACVAFISHSFAESSPTVPPLLSRVEADSRIRVEMEQRKQVEKFRRDSVLGEQALETWFSGAPGNGVVMRRVASRPWSARTSSTESSVPFVRPDFFDALPKVRFINMSVTVFDHQISEIVWRDGTSTFTAVSNIDFNHLAPLGRFQEGDQVWQFLCFVGNHSSEQHAKFAQLIRATGREYTPKSPPDHSMLDPEIPDYRVFAEIPGQVPDALTDALDALHRHYATHGPRLEAQWKRSQTLAEARRAWHEANPPEPRNAIINFWPVQSKRNRTAP